MPRVASSPGGEPSPTGEGNILSRRRRQRNSGSAAGEQRDKPLKPLRAGRREAGVSVVTNSYALFQKRHARLRVHWAPGVPHALFVEGGTFTGKARAHSVARSRECVRCL